MIIIIIITIITILVIIVRVIIVGIDTDQLATVDFYAHVLDRYDDQELRHQYDTIYELVTIV